MNATRILKTIGSVTVGLLLGLSAEQAAKTTIDGAQETVNYFKETKTVKKHFWSKPVEVYARNGKPVKKK